MSADPAPLRLLYFAWVRERAGRDGESLPVPAGVATVGALIAWLRARGDGLAAALADPRRIRVAVNLEHVGFDHPLRPGDEVALFPPITGGAAGGRA